MTDAHEIEEMKGDREVVMTAVLQSGFSLQFATGEMKGDREVVMTAVSRHGRALAYATEEMKGDHEVVMAAVSQDGGARVRSPISTDSKKIPISKVPVSKPSNSSEAVADIVHVRDASKKTAWMPRKLQDNRRSSPGVLLPFHNAEERDRKNIQSLSPA